MAIFTYAPDWGCKPTMQPRILQAQFGDGYDQRAGDGLNTRLPVWPLTFSVRTQTEATAIAAWLATNNADVTPFDWVAPGSGVATSEWFGTGNGTQATFQLTHGGSPVTSIVGTPSIYRTDWQGTQQLYATARTNLLAYSQDFSSAAWLGYAAKPVMTQVAAPDGTNTAWQFASTDSGPYYSGVHQSIAGPVAGPVTVSVWARCLAGTLNVVFGTNDGDYAIFTLTTQWQRIVYVATSGIGAQTNRAFMIYENTPSNTAWQVWGAQSEAGGVLTSYIPTTTAAVTVTDYTLSGTGLVTLASAPVSGAAMTWTGNYTRKYIANKWTSATPDEYNSWSVQAEFRQVPA